MSGKLILYYLALMFFVTWAGSLLVKASRDLCRQAARDYRRPDDAEQDET